MNAKGGTTIATSRRDNRAAMALRQAAFEMVPGYAGNAT